MVVPTFGRPRFLARALESVRAQSLPAAEILIVDDNGLATSNQIETEAVVTRFSDRSGATVRYLPNKRNCGGGQTRNVGVRYSTGEFIAFLDDDDEWLPDFLTNGVAALQDDAADVAYCDCFVVDDRYPNRRKLQVNQKYRGDVWHELVAGWCPTSTSLFTLRGSAVRHRTLFDESLRGFQDYDCWLSLARDCRFTFHNEPSVLRHLHQAGQITSNPATRRIALGVLERKWTPRMNARERSSFQCALCKLEKQIHRMEYRRAVAARDPAKALRSAVDYLTADNFSPRDVYTLLRSTF